MLCGPNCGRRVARFRCSLLSHAVSRRWCRCARAAHNTTCDPSARLFPPSSQSQTLTRTRRDHGSRRVVAAPIPQSTRRPMAETITIPSPSVFLEPAAPLQHQPAAKQQPNGRPTQGSQASPTAKQNPKTTGHKSATGLQKKTTPIAKAPPATKEDAGRVADTGVTKRKQSKSRNGECESVRQSCFASRSYTSQDRHADSRSLNRLHHLQREAAQMRRDKAQLPAMRPSRRRLRWLQEGLQVAPVRGGELHCQSPARQSQERYAENMKLPVIAAYETNEWQHRRRLLLQQQFRNQQVPRTMPAAYPRPMCP